MPGAGFKRQGAEWKKVNDYLHSKPFNDVVEKMKAGTAGDSVVRRLLTPEDGSVIDAEEEDIIKWVVGALYSGGADTTVSALATFVLAMVLYPEVQAKAQEEIERVVGTDRLPGIADRPQLAYVDAVYKETLRWHPVAPLAVPHRVTRDDEYGWCTIPAGATIVANIWAMSRGGEPDPDVFRPERHLAGGGGNEVSQDPLTYVFGFGRRICPGMNLADSEVWLGVVSLLAAFKMVKKSDGQGGLITPKEEYEQGIIWYVVCRTRISYHKHFISSGGYGLSPVIPSLSCAISGLVCPTRLRSFMLLLLLLLPPPPFTTDALALVRSRSIHAHATCDVEPCSLCVCS